MLYRVAVIGPSGPWCASLIGALAHPAIARLVSRDPIYGTVRVRAAPGVGAELCSTAKSRGRVVLPGRSVDLVLADTIDRDIDKCIICSNGMNRDQVFGTIQYAIRNDIPYCVVSTTRGGRHPALAVYVDLETGEGLPAVLKELMAIKPPQEDMPGGAALIGMLAVAVVLSFALARMLG